MGWVCLEFTRDLIRFTCVKMEWMKHLLRGRASAPSRSGTGTLSKRKYRVDVTNSRGAFLPGALRVGPLWSYRLSWMRNTTSQLKIGGCCRNSSCRVSPRNILSSTVLLFRIPFKSSTSTGASLAISNPSISLISSKHLAKASLSSSK